MGRTPLYISEKDAAALLGAGIDWFRANRENLERVYGFPKIDPATGKRHRPSIERWAEARNAPKGRASTNPERIGNHEHF